jgi:hypothetical protein
MTYYYSSPSSLDSYLMAMTAQKNMWVTLEQIEHVLFTLRTVNFASRDSRNSGLEAILSLLPNHPFVITGGTTPGTGDHRFSFLDNGINTPTSLNIATAYVNLDRKGWNNYLNQAQSALQYNDRNNEKTMLTDGGGVTESESVNAPNPQIVRSQFNDASQAFRRAVQGMQTLFRNGVSVYNFLNFENEFGLVWSTIPQLPIDE